MTPNPQGNEKCPKIATNDLEKLWQLVKIQVDDPSSKTDPYMRGMANGLICALAVFKHWEPIYIEEALSKYNSFITSLARQPEKEK